MKNITISLPNETALIRGVPFADLETFSTLIVELQALWVAHDYSLGDLLLSPAKGKFLDLAQKIANLHPRLDTPGAKGWAVEPLLDDLDQLEGLYLLQRGEDDKLSLVKSGLLMRLNRLDAEKKLMEVTALLQQQETESLASQDNSPDSLANAEDMPPPENLSKRTRSGGSRTIAAA